MQSFCRFRDAPLHLRLRDSSVLHAESDLAVGIDVKKLRPWVLKDAADFLRDTVHGQAENILPIEQHLAAQFTLKELRYQAVYEPRQRRLAAAAPPAQQHALPVRDREADIL